MRRFWQPLPGTIYFYEFCSTTPCGGCNSWAGIDHYLQGTGHWRNRNWQLFFCYILPHLLRFFSKHRSLTYREFFLIFSSSISQTCCIKFKSGSRWRIQLLRFIFPLINTKILTSGLCFLQAFALQSYPSMLYLDSSTNSTLLQNSEWSVRIFSPLRGF